MILTLSTLLGQLLPSCGWLDLLAGRWSRPAAKSRMSIGHDGLRGMRETAWGGGRWSAVYSLWTYAHRLLHVVGFTAVDHEEVALLSAPLVRLRAANAQRHVLAHAADPRDPSEPLGLVLATDASLEQTLFLLHFAPTDPSGSVAEANRARLATAFPTETSPRAWIAVDQKSGYLSLTAAEANAAVFEVRPATANPSARRGADVSLYFKCAAGTFLSVAAPQSTRVRVCRSVEGRTEVFCMNTMPVAPARNPSVGCVGDPNQATLAAAVQRTKDLPVRLQSVAHGWFVASSPSAPLAAASKKETGWDAFVIEFDHATSMARIRDSRGLYLILSQDLKSFTAGITRDDPTRAAAALSAHVVNPLTSSPIVSRIGPTLSTAIPASPSLCVTDGVSSKPTPVPVHQRKTHSQDPLADCTSSQNNNSPGLQPPPSLTLKNHPIAEPPQNGKSKTTRGREHLHGDDDGDVHCAGDLPRAERFLVSIHDHHDRVTLRSRKGYLSARPNGTVQISQNTTPGIREQFYLRVALPSMMDQSSPSLRLRHYPQGLREVDASIVIPASASVAYEVLRDYDGFQRFIDDCSESALLERKADGTLVVRMCQAHSFLVLTITMSMTLRVEENDQERKIRMDLIQGLGVKLYKGVWHAIERPDGRCGLRVQISSAPAVPAPNFLVDGVMSHAVTATLEQIRNECILRSSGLSDS
jgi:ribosome-associated toxin RatA of RatAB toxin-antitoxin module